MQLKVLVVLAGNMLKHNTEDTDNLSPMGRDEAVRKYEL